MERAQVSPHGGLDFKRAANDLRTYGARIGDQTRVIDVAVVGVELGCAQEPAKRVLVHRHLNSQDAARGRLGVLQLGYARAEARKLGLKLLVGSARSRLDARRSRRSTANGSH
jgi:hypothetical protein